MRLNLTKKKLILTTHFLISSILNNLSGNMLRTAFKSKVEKIKVKWIYYDDLNIYIVQRFTNIYSKTFRNTGHNPTYTAVGVFWSWILICSKCHFSTLFFFLRKKNFSRILLRNLSSRYFDRKYHSFFISCSSALDVIFKILE